MVMVADSLPGLKRWTAGLGLRDSAELLVIRMVVTFLLHAGRMSCLRAAGRSAARRDTGPRSAVSCAATVAETRYQLDLAAEAAGTRGQRRPLPLPRRRHVEQSGR